jgi:ligand-binding sensor domain-containing protein/signal transduction histidine kinase
VRVLLSLTLLLAVGASPPAAALDPRKTLADCSANLFRGRDGLPGAWIRAITQTRDGFLLVGTNGGLVRYDGARLVPIASPRPFSRGADVYDLILGRDGQPFVVTSYDHPLCLHGSTAEECLSKGQRPPPGSRFFSAYQEPGGMLWLIGREALFRVVGDKVERLDEVLGKLPFSRATAVLRDQRGRLLIGSPEGLFELQGDHAVPLITPQGPITAAIESLFQAPGGRLWVATRGALWRLQGDQWTSFPMRDDGHQAKLIEDRDGNVWIGTMMGLTRFRDGRFTTFTTHDGLPDKNVTAVFEDREGSLWVGTRAGGLVQFTDRTVDTQAAPPRLRNEWIDSLCETADGAQWFGTHFGLTRWKNSVETTWDEKSGLLSAAVFAVLPGRADPAEVWVGTSLGLSRWTDQKPEPKIETIARLEKPVRSLYLDRAGTLYVGSEGALFRLPEGKTTLEPVEHAAGFDPLQIRGMQEDDQGVLWVAATGGLAMIDRSNGKLRRAPLPAGMILPPARAIHRDAQGVLWFGSAGNGLLRRSGGTFRVFGTADGVPDQLNQVLSDDLGFLWLGTGGGILRVAESDLLNPQRRAPVRLVTFDTSDQHRDVSAMNVRQPGAWVGRDGRLWFASWSGALTIDPHRVRINEVPPPVLIEEASVDGRAVNLQRTGALQTFPPGPGNLEFHFTAVTLLEPYKAVHRYQLEGFDRGWTTAGARRVAYYTNIPPGQYHFRVQGSNADGIWNLVGDGIAFELRPHIYRTRWFYGLCLVLLAGVAALLYHGRLARLRREYLAAFAERSRLARELHDTLLQGMSVVAMQLGSVRRRLGPGAGPAIRDLEAIEHVVTSSLEETRRLVWNLRERPGPANDLGATIGRLAERMAEGQKARCRVSVEGDAVRLSNEVQDTLFRITQEALTNAFKHANADHIDVRLCYEQGAVKLSVSDDGQGFDPARAQGPSAGHFGLLGMRERAAPVGRLDVDTRPGLGTTITVTVTITPSGGLLVP